MNWEEQEMVTLADANTFHLANTAPQVQHFNSGYVEVSKLHPSHAKKGNKKLYVLTEPAFQEDNLIIHSIKIPLRF